MAPREPASETQTGPTPPELETPRLVVGIGEILWDCFGTERHLGGAPANFAYHVHALGDRGVPVSRVGDDEPGRELIAAVAGLGIPTDYLQRDAVHPTGQVVIEFDPSGEPEFNIAGNAAWDFIEMTDPLEQLAADADAVCFGTLAQRDPTSRRTIGRFVAAARRALVVCDLNLRGPLIDLGSEDEEALDIVRHSMEAADILKLNEGEFATLARALRTTQADDRFAERLLSEFRLRLVCVTRGPRGCVLHGPGGRAECPGIEVEVADPVGAGDAFTAALVHQLLRQRPLAEVARFANRVGAYVASQPGATPPIDRARLPE